MSNPRPTAARPTPLWAVLTFTFLASIGTGIVTNGIFFLTKQGFGFTRTQNFLLGLLLGVTYVVGSLGAGPAIAGLRRMMPRISARSILAVVLVLLGALSALPALAQRYAPDWSSASVWVLVAIYSPLTGVLWPTVEAFVAGGRRAEVLRGAMGIWNVVWSGAIIIAYWGMAPVIESYAPQTLLALGGLHVVTALFLLAFQPEPGEHAEEHEPHPPVYAALLVTFRMLLPMSYVVSSALAPYMPSAMSELGIPGRWQTVLGTAWLIPRTLAFLALERWHGWHGRWSTAIVGGALLLTGFAVTVLAPALVPPGRTPADGPYLPGAVLLLVGLGVFGVGMATIYSAAIYYAMEVGNARVDAGGTHEALIGVGYTIGPAIGLSASVAVERGLLGDRAFNGAVLGAVGVVALAVTVAVVRRVARHARAVGG